jgi:hypothetical protein
MSYDDQSNNLQKSDIITNIVALVIAFIISITLSFNDDGTNITTYYVGYSIYGAMAIITIVFDVFVSIPRSKKETKPEIHLERYLAKNKDGSLPVFIKRINPRSI